MSFLDKPYPEAGAALRNPTLRERLTTQKLAAQETIANADRIMALLDKNPDVDELLELLNR